jgi:hypothetical protein
VIAPERALARARHLQLRFAEEMPTLALVRLQPHAGIYIARQTSGRRSVVHGSKWPGVSDARADVIELSDYVSRSAVGTVMSPSTFLPPLSGSRNNLDGAVA